MSNSQGRCKTFKKWIEVVISTFIHLLSNSALLQQSLALAAPSKVYCELKWNLKDKQWNGDMSVIWALNTNVSSQRGRNVTNIANISITLKSFSSHTTFLFLTVHWVTESMTKRELLHGALYLMQIMGTFCCDLQLSSSFSSSELLSSRCDWGHYKIPLS